MIGAALPRRIAFGALILVGAAPAGSSNDGPADRIRIAVSPGSGSVVQRLTLPPAALAAARFADLRDIRVVDANGRAVPMARVPAAPAMRRDVLGAMPILGAADALKIRGLSLQIDAGGQARVARVDGTPAPGGARPVVLGILFDARTLEGTASGLTLDADVPVAQPVTFTVEASRDLSAWRLLGEKVIYRAANAGTEGGPGTGIPLGSASLRGDYLKVTWRLASRPLSPVVVRQATLLRQSGVVGAIVWVDAVAPPLADARAIQFNAPFATPIALLRVMPAGEDVLVPVRILGRDGPERPWTLLGQGVAARLPAGPGTTGAIRLSGGAFRTLRIETDAGSAGFTAAPALQLGLARRDVLFLAVGRPPFTLVAGGSGDGTAYLPAASLMTQSAERRIANAEAAVTPARVLLTETSNVGRDGRRATLWIVLLIATALLAGLAWALWKSSPRDPEPGG